MTTGLIYVYCLVRAPRRPSLRNVPDGMPDSSELRALDAGNGLWAVVANVPAGDYDESALARGLQDLDWVGHRAMAHESVVEHFLGASAVLPMQLFTLFTSDERALAHVARDRARIDRILGRIERQVEWGVRLSFDANAVRAAADAPASRARSRHAAEVDGTSYLARKRDLLDVSRARLAEARGAADRLYRALSREASEARRRTATEQAVPGSRVILDAAFLVPRDRGTSFKAALRQHTRKLQDAGVVASLTGPWPPYNFIDRPARARATRRATSSTSRRRSARSAHTRA